MTKGTEGDEKGHLTYDLCVMAGALRGQGMQQRRVMSNYGERDTGAAQQTSVSLKSD